MPPSPPPLRPFDLVLHRDGRFRHEGAPITHPRLRALFERSVRYLPDEAKYVVQVGRFRGQIELEEAGFFVRDLDLARGTIALSDRTEERLDPTTLRPSALDPDALLCSVKRALVAGGLPARFERGAQAELLLAVEETPRGPALRIAGVLEPLPPRCDPRSQSLRDDRS